MNGWPVIASNTGCWKRRAESWRPSSVTVFAPADEAFDALPEGTVDGLLEDPTGPLAEILTYPDGRDQALAVILHELGHLVGLGHVDDQGELMHPRGHPCRGPPFRRSTATGG